MTIKKNTKTLIDASKEVGLEINVEKTMYKLLSRRQKVGQNRDIKIAKGSFENASQLKYLGTTVTNQNLIEEVIKKRLNSGNACYHSVQNLLSPRLLSKNLKIRIYKTIILPVVRLSPILLEGREFRMSVHLSISVPFPPIGTRKPLPLYEAHPVCKVPWGRLQKQNTIS
jgi:hypothetical protein